MTSCPPYRPDGTWAELLDTTARIESGELSSDECTRLIERLAMKLELLGGQREKDIGRLLRALVDSGEEYFDGLEDEDEDGEGEEAAPLKGD